MKHPGEETAFVKSSTSYVCTRLQYLYACGKYCEGTHVKKGSLQGQMDCSVATNVLPVMHSVPFCCIVFKCIVPLAKIAAPLVWKLFF